MATNQPVTAATAQQAIDQLKQAIAANPEAVQQAATDAVASLRTAIASLTAKEKAEIVVMLRQLEARVSEARLKGQLAELITQLSRSA